MWGWGMEWGWVWAWAGVEWGWVLIRARCGVGHRGGNENKMKRLSQPVLWPK